MIPLDRPTLLAAFVIFCRIGTCLAFAPGFSSPRIPARVRLFIALGLTIALSPPLLQDMQPSSVDWAGARMMITILRECLVGATMGVMARMMFASLETTFTVASMAIGLTSSFAPRVDDGETLPEFASLVLFATTTLLFVTDMHWEIVRAIYDSYSALPVGSALSPRLALSRVTETLSAGFLVAFRLASPFIVFGILANFAFALLNRITPQIPVYFVVTPLIMLGGVALLPGLWPDISAVFISALHDWLARG